MSKKLHQIKWDRGQVDVDLTGGTISRIVNLDISEYGRAVTRDVLEKISEVYSPGAVIGIVKVIHDGGEYLVLASSVGVYVIDPSDNFRYVAGSNYTDIDGIEIDQNDPVSPDKSSVCSDGKVAIVSLVSESGDRIGSVKCYKSSSTTLLKMPVFALGDANVSAEIDVSDRWTFKSAVAETPSLSIRCANIYESFVGNGKFAVLWKTSRKLAEVDEAVSDISSGLSDQHSVGIVCCVRPDAGGSYSKGAVVDYSVQLVHDDGSMSKMSNVETIRIVPEDNDNTDWRYSVGLVIVVPMSIDRSVKAVNIYRKISSYGDLSTDSVPQADSELIYTAYLGDSDISEIAGHDAYVGSENVLPYMSHGRDMGVDDFGDVTTFDDDIGIDITTIGTILRGASHCNGYDRTHAVGLSLQVSSDNVGGLDWLVLKNVGYIDGKESVVYDYGWLKSSYGECAVHVPKCISVLGGKVRHAFFGSSGGGLVFENGIGSLVSSGAGSVSQPVFVFGGSSPDAFYASDQNGAKTASVMSLCMNVGESLPSSPISASVIAALIGNNGGQFSFPGFGRDTEAFDISDCDKMYYASSSSDEMLDLNATFEYANRAVRRAPYVAFVDDGSVAIYTESSYTGVLSDDVASIKPGIVGLVGGRLVSIDPDVDGERKSSSVYYSQYGIYTLFSKNNYISYSKSGIGGGVAISQFKGIMLLHFEDGVAVIDARSSSDMQWRELGLYTGVSTISRRAVVETPVGVFWVGREDCYWFNGSKVVVISNSKRSGVSVRDSLRSLFSRGTVYAFYIDKTRSVVFASGKDSMVFDVDGMSWHEYQMSEAEHPDSITAMSSIRIDGNDRVFCQLDLISDEQVYRTHVYRWTNSYAPEWMLEARVDLGAPEIVKKAKRLYIDLRPEANSECLAYVKVWGDDRAESEVDEKEIRIQPGDGGVKRLQVSCRGRTINVKVYTKEGLSWRGRIESIGMSYKPKSLK